MTLYSFMRAACVGLILASAFAPMAGHAEATADSGKGLSFGKAFCGTPTPCDQWRANAVIDPTATIQLAQSCLGERLGIAESTDQFASTRPDSQGCMTGKGDKMQSGYILYPTCCIKPTPSNEKLCVMQCETYARPQ